MLPCKALCLLSAEDFKDKWSLEVDADFSGGFSRHRINIEQQPRCMQVAKSSVASVLR